MAKRSTGISLAKRKFKEGAGQGSGPGYDPFLTIRDVPSLGVGVRKYWELMGRVCHFLSLLEAAAFIYFSSLSKVLDIREQYPMSLEDTLRLAGELGIKHPGMFRGKMNPHILTTDLVLTMDDPEFWRTRILPVYVKYVKDLQTQRENDKVKIFRAYWDERGSELLVFTEQTVPKGLLRNLELLEMAKRRWPTEKPPISAEMVKLAEQHLMVAINAGQECLGLACRRIDDTLQFNAGSSLELVRRQLAIGEWDLEDWTIILDRNSFIRVRRVLEGERLDRRITQF